MPGRGVRATPAANAQGIKWLPVQPTSKFYGRNKELEEMRKIFTNETPREENYIDIALTSTSGIGKSQLVLKFIDENNDKFKNIIWIPSDSNESIENTLLHVYRVNNFYMESLDTWECISRLYDQLCINETLIVFDNALIEVTDYLPVNRSKLTTILTSQLSDWCANIYVPIREMRNEYCLQLVQDNIQCSEQDAYKLYKTLNNNTLAIKIAIQYIKFHNENNIEYSKIDIFCIKYLESNDFILNIVETESNKKLLNILDKTLEMLQTCENGNLALKLLKLSSYMTSGTKYLYNLPGYDRDTIVAAFKLLKTYSFINHNDSNAIAETTKVVIRYLYKNEEKSLITELISLIPQTNDFVNSPIDTLLEIMKHAVKYEDLIEQNHEIFMKSILCEMYSSTEEKDRGKEIVKCVEKIITKLEVTLGWNSDVFLRYVEKLLLISIRTESKLKKALELICKIENLPDKGRNIIENIKYKKIRCLMGLGRLQEAWEINNEQFEELYNGQYSFRLFTLLEVKCEIACKISEVNNCNTEILSCIPLLQEILLRNVGSIGKYEFQCLKLVIQQLLLAGKNNEALNLVSNILIKLENNPNYSYFNDGQITEASKKSISKLKILKAECYAKNGNSDLSWNIIKSFRPLIKKDHDHHILLECCKIIPYLAKRHIWIAARMFIKLLQKIPFNLSYYGFERLEAIHLLEEILLSRNKYVELFDGYKFIQEEYKNCNVIHSVAKLDEAVLLCKLNVFNEAWTIFDYVCKKNEDEFLSGKITTPVRPDNGDEILNMIVNFRNRYVNEHYLAICDEDQDYNYLYRC